MGLDRNATVWQRREAAVTAATQDVEIPTTAEQRRALTSALHSYVIDERTDAVAAAAGEGR